MATLAMLDVFSGKPNPVWPIGDDLVTQMQQVTGVDGQSAATNLGYRGFQIIGTDKDMTGVTATTADTLGAFTQQKIIQGNPQAEKALLSSGAAAGAIGSDLSTYVSQCIDNPTPAVGPAIAGGATCPPNGGTDAPAYNPSYWNGSSRQSLNNCYAYANNNATDTFSQPGRGSGQIFASLDCDGVRTASVRDGLVVTDTYQASRAGWYVALVIWPGQDYHWYRQDDVGCWSHKPGPSVARNIDHSGNAIADPQQCDRGPYTVFCTYMVSSTAVTSS